MGKLITFLVAVVAVVVWVTGIFVWLSAHRLDTTPFVLFLGTIVGTGVPALINMYKSFELHKDVKVVQQGVDEAKEAALQTEINTNGSLKEQFREVKAKIDQIGGE